MAILTGFPPSNTISLGQPSKFTCELCGKDFWQSFPLTLSLSLDCGYAFMPCRECYTEDQGKKYWGLDRNKWGDHFHIYSKVREGYSYEEIKKIYFHYHYNEKHEDPAGQSFWIYPNHVKRTKVCWYYEKTLGDTMKEKMQDLMMAVNRQLNCYALWSPWGKKENIPNTLIFRANPRICELFTMWDNGRAFTVSEKPFFGILKCYNRTYKIKSDPIIPDSVTSVWLEEEKKHCGNHWLNQRYAKA